MNNIIRNHKLKILPEYFNAVSDGTKTFEIRFNDRGYAVGDVLILREWTIAGGYTGRVIRKRVTYVLDDGTYLKEGYVALGLSDAENNS